MKVELPTEEDVLAALVLRYLAIAPWPERYDFDHDVTPDYARALCAHRLPPGANLLTLGAAIADSERRLDCERARDAVVEAAREWGVRIFAGKRTNGDLLSAVCVLEAALMRCGAEVSRHGG